MSLLDTIFSAGAATDLCVCVKERVCMCVSLCQVTFIYIALLTIQIVTKQLHNIKIGK